MSLKKKIALSFFISASIIAVLIAFQYLNFVEIKKEIKFLELTDTIRTKSLQLRRHEKNYFLYSPQKEQVESREVHRYIRELKGTLEDSLPGDKTGSFTRLNYLVEDYKKWFVKIESDVRFLRGELQRAETRDKKLKKFLPLVELTFYERPLEGAEFLEKGYLFVPEKGLIDGLKGLDQEIKDLRKDGEDIIAVSKELDKTARDNVDGLIMKSQAAMIVIFSLFLVIGIGTLFYIISNITGRLRLLSAAIERTGKGPLPYKPVHPSKWDTDDEVGLLIREFNKMEELLAQRERELLHTKKLAAIGTLASGVAHELNNPLNNIYISAQILARETGESAKPVVKEVVGDIVGQTARVKRIVGDLLEFARGREPQLKDVDIKELIAGVNKFLGGTSAYSAEKIKFRLDSESDGVVVEADPEQLERVFINLFMNAADAMSGEGGLSVSISQEDGNVKVKVSDTGKGINAEEIEKIFEPFYTTKDKGTGLGLAIVFSIIKKHGGDITVASEPGRGTVFTITLPKRKA